VVKSAGSTALLSPHIVTDVEDACDRLAILGTGEIGFQSSDSPKSEFVRRSGSAEN
jgi:ABC-type multidrug transport system ATPase subunit